MRVRGPERGNQTVVLTADRRLRSASVFYALDASATGASSS